MRKFLPYRQKNKWTCGPAIVKVILDYFGIKRSLEELIKELGTTKEGTDNKELLRVLAKYKLNYKVKQNSTLVDIKKYIPNYLVIVGYFIPYYQESHYAIVKKITRDRIYLHDTWFGPNHKLTIKHFLKNWWDEDNRKWLLAIKK